MSGSLSKSGTKGVIGDATHRIARLVARETARRNGGTATSSTTKTAVPMPMRRQGSRRAAASRRQNLPDPLWTRHALFDPPSRPGCRR